MPYIAAQNKEGLANGADPRNAGELTYLLQQKLASHINAHGLCYQSIAECLGALEGAKADLVDRVLKPYEAKKNEENGDVWSPWMTTVPTAADLELERAIADQHHMGD